MGTVSGNVIVRAESEDPITWQMLKDDGVTPIGDLTGITDLTLRLIDVKSQVAKLFVDPKFIVSDALESEVTLKQVKTDFPLATLFEFYTSFTDGVGNGKAVPEDKNYTFRVIAKIGT